MVKPRTIRHKAGNAEKKVQMPMEYPNTVWIAFAITMTIVAGVKIVETRRKTFF